MKIDIDIQKQSAEEKKNEFDPMEFGHPWSEDPIGGPGSVIFEFYDGGTTVQEFEEVTYVDDEKFSVDGDQVLLFEEGTYFRLIWQRESDGEMIKHISDVEISESSYEDEKTTVTVSNFSMPYQEEIIRAEVWVDLPSLCNDLKQLGTGSKLINESFMYKYRNLQSNWEWYSNDFLTEESVWESEYGNAENENRWVRKPIGIVELDHAGARDTYKRWTMQDSESVDHKDPRFNFRIELKSPDADPTYDGNADKKLDSTGKKLKKVNSGDPTDAGEIQFNAGAGTRCLKFSEVGSRSYATYLDTVDNGDGTRGKIIQRTDWLEPHSIFFSPFDTSDSDNIKVTTEPSFDAEEVNGSFIKFKPVVNQRIQVYLIPRKWGYYTRHRTGNRTEETYQALQYEFCGGTIDPTADYCCAGGYFTESVSPDPKTCQCEISLLKTLGVVTASPTITWGSKCYNPTPFPSGGYDLETVTVYFKEFTHTNSHYVGLWYDRWPHRLNLQDPSIKVERTLRLGSFPVSMEPDLEVITKLNNPPGYCFRYYMPNCSSWMWKNAGSYSPDTWFPEYIFGYENAEDYPWYKFIYEFAICPGDIANYPGAIQSEYWQNLNYTYNDSKLSWSPSSTYLIEIPTDESRENAISNYLVSHPESTEKEAEEAITCGFNGFHFMDTKNNSFLYFHMGGSPAYTCEECGGLYPAVGDTNPHPVKYGNTSIGKMIHTEVHWEDVDPQWKYWEAYCVPPEPDRVKPIWDKVIQSDFWLAYGPDIKKENTLYDREDNFPYSISLAENKEGTLLAIVKISTNIYYIWQKIDETIEDYSITGEGDEEYVGHELYPEDFRHREGVISPVDILEQDFVQQTKGTLRKITHFGRLPDIGEEVTWPGFNCKQALYWHMWPLPAHDEWISGIPCKKYVDNLITIIPSEDVKYELDTPVHLMFSRERAIKEQLKEYFPAEYSCMEQAYRNSMRWMRNNYGTNLYTGTNTKYTRNAG